MAPFNQALQRDLAICAGHHYYQNYIRRIAVIRAYAKLCAPRERRFWVRKAYEDYEQGAYNVDIRSMMLHDGKLFFDYFRMRPGTLQQLLNWVGADIKKQDTKFRAAIPPGERLCMTIRHLSTGHSQLASLAQLVRRRAPVHTVAGSMPSPFTSLRSMRTERHKCSDNSLR
jgi:hypothetical protein